MAEGGLANVGGRGSRRGPARVLVDEMGANTPRWRPSLYAWCPDEESGRLRACRATGERTSPCLLASMSAEGMGPCLAVEGSTTGEVFKTYPERVLAPSLRPGQVVVMDKTFLLTKALGCASSSRGEAASSCTCAALFARSQSHRRSVRKALKALLRRAGARTHEALIEAMGRALDAVTASDARGFFEHRGYRAKAHLL